MFVDCCSRREGGVWFEGETFRTTTLEQGFQMTDQLADITGNESESENIHELFGKAYFRKNVHFKKCIF